MSTGQLHGFESLQQARLLLALDFAGDLVDVISQPFRLRFHTSTGYREHTRDFLAYTRSGRWLIDVRPAARVGAEDRVAFAASAEVALLLGWCYARGDGLDVVCHDHGGHAVGAGLVDVLLAAVTGGPQPFGELAEGTIALAVARACLAAGSRHLAGSHTHARRSCWTVTARAQAEFPNGLPHHLLGWRFV